MNTEQSNKHIWACMRKTLRPIMNEYDSVIRKVLSELPPGRISWHESQGWEMGPGSMSYRWTSRGVFVYLNHHSASIPNPLTDGFLTSTEHVEFLVSGSTSNKEIVYAKLAELTEFPVHKREP